MVLILYAQILSNKHKTMNFPATTLN